MIFRKILLASFALVSIFVSVHAAELDPNPIDSVLPDWDGVNEIKNLPQANLRDELLPIVARFLIYGMAFVAFLVFFAAGTWLVIGWGEEESTKKAKSAIIWAIVGLAFAAGSYFLVKGIIDLNFGWDDQSTVENQEEEKIEDVVGVPDI